MLVQVSAVFSAVTLCHSLKSPAEYKTAHQSAFVFQTFTPMKPVKNITAVAFLVTVVFILYSTFYLEKTHKGKLDVHQLRSLWIQEGDGKTSTPAMATAQITQSLSIYNKLRQAIPQNGAYWNRLLYSTIKQVENGKDPFSRDSDWSRCRESNQEQLKTNIHDILSYSSILQDFLQIMNCRSPPLLINQPNKCTSGREADNQTLLLFGIKSVPGNFEQRQAVRKTWGQEGLFQNGLRVRTVFLLGRSSQGDLDPLLSFESQHFGDLLQWDIQESLLNLTLKLNAFFEWTLNHCPQVSFVFSGDDDVFVNSPALFTFLESLEPSKASYLYVGQVLQASVPFRDPKSKYYVPLSFYDGSYPPYVGGGGFVISGTLLQPLASLSRIVPLFPMDDVYTGMCLQAVGVSPVENSGFKTFDIKEEDRENLCVYKNLILIHQRSPQQIKKLWNGIHNPLLTC